MFNSNIPKILKIQKNSLVIDTILLSKYYLIYS